LRIGETGRYDVDEDGKPDITATLVGITDGIANITFANIIRPVTDTNKTSATVQPDKKSMAPLIAAIVGILVVMGIIGLILRNRRSAN
jgi:hypothetical protein